MEYDKDNLEFRLSQYLDGQLPPEQMEDLEDRMGEDPELRRELQQYAKLDEILSGLAMPDELEQVDFDAQRQEIMARLERKALRIGRPKVNVIRLAFAGAAAVAAGLVIVLTVRMFFTSGHVAQPGEIAKISANSANVPNVGNGSVAVASVVEARPADSAEIAVAMVAPAPQDPAQSVVVVEYVPDKNFHLPPEEATTNASSAPTGTVLMIGGSPRPSRQASAGFADLMSLD